MRFCLAVPLCALCLFPSMALQQEVFSAPIVDKSDTGGPFQVIGKVTLQESMRVNELAWSWGEKVAVKNVSDKPILFFVITISEVGRHSAPVARRIAPGDGPTYQLEDDRFFNEKLIEPGDSLVLRDTSPGDPDVACCINQLADTHDPFVEYRLQFVQFADGSTFGDPSKARDSLAIRETILRGLHELLQSYEDAGESGFVAKLKELRSYLIDPSIAPKVEQPPFFATTVGRQILAKYDTGGISSALDKARESLNTANKHAAMIAVRPSS